MKKTTLYTLLCTTIILPGALLAAQNPNDGQPGTPIGKAAKLKQEHLINGAPKTPQLREEQKVLYANKLLSPDTKALYVEMGTAEARKKRDEDQQAKLEEVLKDASEKRLQRELAQEEAKRLEEEQAHKLLVEKAREAALQKQEANEALEKKITQLDQEVKDLTQRLSNSAEVKKLSAEKIKSMSEELKTKSEQLATAQQQLRETQNHNQVLEKRVLRAEAGEVVLAEGLNAIIAEKQAGNAGGGAQGGAGQGAGDQAQGGRAGVINNGAQGVPVDNGQPNANAGGDAKAKKTMKKANYGANDDAEKDGEKDGKL